MLLRGATFVVALFFVVLALFATAERAYAQTNTSGIPGGLCMQQAYDAAGGSSTLSCNSNDVKFSQFTNLTSVTSCLEGESLSVTLRAEVKSNATTKYDVGIFVGENGGSALDGATCYRDILSPRITPINTNPTTTQLQNGFGPYRNQDGDSCGDIRSTDAISFKVLQPITVVCRDSNATDGVDRLTVSAGTSWDVNAGAVCNTALNTAPSSSPKCFYGNVNVANIVFRRSARVEVRKDVVSALPLAQETGRFNLLINGTQRTANAYDTNLAAGISGPITSTGSLLVDAGTSATPGATVSVGESAGANSTNLGDYTNSITCVKRGSPTTVVAGPVTATSVSWNIQPNDDIICTITNTRKTATVEVKKVVTPLGDPGAFNLTINGPGDTFDYTAPNQPNGGTTGTRVVTPGAFSFSETGGASPATNLLNYNATYACTNKGVALVPPVSGTGATISPITVASGDVIVCTFTNARKSGSLVITKVVAGPSNTPNTSWSFGVTGPTPSTQPLAVTGLGQSSTLPFKVNSGTYAIAELGGSSPATDPALFNTTALCTGATNGNNGTYNSSTRTISGLQIANNDNVTCTFTNTRKQGKLEVKKAIPSPDGSLWTLVIDGVISKPDQTHGGSTGEQVLATGRYNISESGASAANYNSTLACVLDGTTQAVDVTGNTGIAGTVAVGEGQDIVCTFTNTRKTGTVTVNKVVVAPAGYTDAGRFNLQINNVTFASNVGNGGSTGAQTINTNPLSVGETPNASTDIANYSTAIVCKKGDVVIAQNSGQLNLGGMTLSEGDNVVCTITNTRKTRTITVIKQAIGGSAIFDFAGVGAPVSPSFTLSTTTNTPATDASPALSSAQTQFTVPSGAYTISEGASPAGWDFTSLACVAGGSSSGVQSPANARQAQITVANDGDVTCTWTNTKRGTIVVTKNVNWNGTPIVPGQEFEICIQGPQSQNPLPAAECQTGPIGQFTFTNLLPGTYSVFENSLNPTIGWFVASSEGEPTLVPGGTALASIMNKRTVGPIKVSPSISTRWTKVYSWDLDKTVDPTQVSLFDGEQTVLNYTVTTVRTEEDPVGLALFGTVKLTNSSTQTTSLVQEPEGLLPGPTTAVFACNQLILADNTIQVIDPPVSSWPYGIPPEATLVCGYDMPVASFVTGTATFTATLDNLAADAFTNTATLSAPQWDVPTTTISETISVVDTRVAGWTFPQSDDTPYVVTYPQNLKCSDLGDIAYVAGESLDHLYENTASVDGSTTIDPVTASVNVDCYRLLVTKTAVPTYTLDFDWTIEKSVLPLDQTLYEDESGELNYTVKLTKDDGDAKDFAAKGEIVITNPNPVSDATLDGVVDIISNEVYGYDNPVSCESLLVLKGGGTLTCTYDVDVPTATTSSVYTNTAYAELFSKVYTDTAVVDFSGVSPKLIDDSIVVTDTNVPAGLGTFDATTSKPYTTYPTCVGFDDYTDGTGSFAVNNTAGIVVLNKTASALANVNCVQYGKITITKTVSDSTPSDWSFGFTLSGQANKTVTNAANTATWNKLLPNQSYTLAEVDPGSEWITTPIVCTVGDEVLGDADAETLGLQLAVSPGADIQCATENIATVDVSMEKVYTGPAMEWEFTFNLGGSPIPTARTVTQVQTTATWSNLTPNQIYVLTEEDPGPGYAQKPVACYLNDSTEPLASVPGTSGGFYLDPAPGDVITCSIENVERGTVTIEKQTVPDESSANPKTAFEFTSDLTGLTAFSLTDGQARTATVDPSTYTVSEVAKAGWDLTSALCHEAGTPGQTFSPSTIVVDPGDQVTCLFTNTKGLARIFFETPTATNAVGTSHNFTVTVQTSIDNGGSWQPVASQLVTGALVAPVVGTLATPTCTTNTLGQCALTVTSTGAGVTTLNATAAVDVLGLTTTVSTSGAEGFYRDAAKTWTDLRIKIEPLTATNPVNAPHTFTVTVQSTEDGINWSGVAGAAPDISYIGTAPGTGPLACAAVTDTEGECTFTINSSVVGVFTVQARVTVELVPGQPLTRTTGDGVNMGLDGSDNAVKRYEEGALKITKVVEPSFKRSFTWAIEKVVTPDTLHLFDGQTQDVDYTVTVTKSAPVDTEHKIAGTVTISNTSLTNPVIIESVEDVTALGTAITLNCGAVTFPGYVLAAGTELACSYAATDVDPLDAANNVTVTTTSGTVATTAADILFATPTITVNNGITVTDDLTTTVFGPYTASAKIPYSKELSCTTQAMTGYVEGVATGAITNTATINYGAVTGALDKAVVNVNCYQLLVHKTAIPTYDNRYTWEISKTVDPTSVDLLQGNTADLDYTVQVTRTGPVAENFAVSGVITVTNPHPTEGATLDSLTDRLTNYNPDTGDNAFVPVCASLDVPANGGKLVCTYGGSVVGVDQYSVETNQAAATFLGTPYYGTADVDFGSVTPTEIHPSITVTDTNQPLPLGENVSENRSFNYTLVTGCENTVWNEATDLWEKTLPNIAQIRETGQSADASVDVRCEKAGKIIVKKLTDPAGNAQVFDFTSTIPNGSAFQLSHGMTTTFGVSAGVYTITEVLPATGWDLTGARCELVDENTDPIEEPQVGAASVLEVAAAPNPLVVTVDGGETWQCTFTNTQWGSLAVQKIAPDDVAKVFSFESSIAGEGVPFASLKHTESYNQAVRPGYYNITELVPDGWTLRSISDNCRLNDSAAQSAEQSATYGVDPTAYAYVAPGLTTTCVFTNSLPSIVVTKTATPEQVPNPGADVVFNVQVQNTSKLDPVMINSLQDSIYGNITTVQGDIKATTCVLNTVLQPGQVYACNFTAYVGVAQGVTDAFEEIDWVTAKGITDKLAPVEASDDAKVVVLAATATVGDHVWLDRNPNGTTTPEKLAGDGLQNDPANEPGVGNIAVQLMFVGPDGKPNTPDDVVAGNTTTDGAGKYSFTKVAPGTYYMIFTKPDSSRAWSSKPNVGNDPTIDSDVIVDAGNPNRALTGVIIVDAGAVDYSWDAALVDTTGAASSDLGDFVWDDTANKNGIQEPGEPGLANIKVDLYLASGATAQGAAPFDSTTTDVNGFYFFRGLDPATYFIVFNVPSGYSVSPKNAGGNPATDSDADATGRTVDIVLPDMFADLTWDAGLYVTPTADDPSEEPQMSVSIFLPAVLK